MGNKREENGRLQRKRRPWLLIALGILACASLAAVAVFLWSRYGAPKAAACEHPSWENGACTVCGEVCEHPSWENGVCAVCGTVCEHPSWENGACAVCGTACEHPNWEDGVCAVCGTVCEHPAWNHGVCKRCGFVCPHEKHDPDTARCLCCGEQMVHSYYEWHCVGCGREPIQTEIKLPSNYFENAKHRGSIVKDSFDYKGYEQMLRLYLPYGYDENGHYNLAILLHGGNGDIANTIDTEFHTADGYLRAYMLYDHMIEDHLCEPFIVASIYTGDYYNYGPVQLGQVIHDGLLPYLAEHYATFAESGSPEDLRAARMHFAIGGHSVGGLFACYSGMVFNFDYIANYIVLSAGPDFITNRVAPAVREYEAQGIGFGVFYDAAGAWEARKLKTKPPFYELLEAVDSLEEEKNAFYREVDNEHTWTSWFACYYNGLQVLFPAEEPAAPQPVRK